MAIDVKELPNRFDFAEAQPRIYQMWLAGDYFHADTKSDKPPFCMVIPPPNVTGALHLGHALNNTLQDIVIRHKRMQGYNALWVPGTDHAGIATQAVVERRLKEELGKTRHDLGRQSLVERIWRWKDQYEQRILGQLQSMGCSCDWKRTRFTLDVTCARAVRHTFFNLFQKSLIYRGKRLVNWDTFLQTAVSDDEVFNQTVQGHFWHFQYPIIEPRPGEPQYVTIATTRPETMLGDTAVAVHPDPAAALDRYEHELRERMANATSSEIESIQSQWDAAQRRRSKVLDRLICLKQMAERGCKVRLPLMDREIPLVTDSWAKPELGSGCVKITPAHDPNDYEVAKRCGLPMIDIMNPDGTLNAETGRYRGLTLKEGRAKVIQDMQQLGLLEEVEDRDIELPHSDRSKTPIEPRLADQWFVRMETLAQSAMDAVSDGRVRITPVRYEKGYLDWLAEKRDWPVSRQLWWGHQIPVWSIACQTEQDIQSNLQKIRSAVDFSTQNAAVQVELCEELDERKRQELQLPAGIIHVCLRHEGDPLERQILECGAIREEDVLDTWFSSALWPHSTLGWPEATAEMDTFYPTNTLITSRDIITLWVARMVLASLNNVGMIPFKQVYIHPKILDGFGETMSKSKGNGIDPLDVIDKFGADALRFGMASLTTETQDVRLPVRFECPHCDYLVEQTKKNRIQPVIDCASCGQSFSTQWAETEQQQALPRGPVVSDRFEVARNFGNKLWNASRFAMIHLQDCPGQAIIPTDLTLEDRWILSRLATVSENTTQNLEHFKFAEVTRELYDFAWDEFCSFYIEMLKDRLADSLTRSHAQQMLAYTLDVLLRLLHPVIPFITEELWQMLGLRCPLRGFETAETASPSVMIALWPNLPTAWKQPAIEEQFSHFQSILGALREIRSGQNLAPKTKIDFSVRAPNSVTELIQPMSVFFGSMAHAQITEIGPNVQPPKICATVSKPHLEIFVSLAGLIDVTAEISRLTKEKAKLDNALQGNQRKLSDERFACKAPPEVVQRARETVVQLQSQIQKIEEALHDLTAMR